jgi:hypothetical protein
VPPQAGADATRGHGDACRAGQAQPAGGVTHARDRTNRKVTAKCRVRERRVMETDTAASPSSLVSGSFITGSRGSHPVLAHGASRRANVRPVGPPSGTGEPCDLRECWKESKVLRALGAGAWLR